jgi:multisubunit Na+/H+ antiporter MnhB subunit
MNRSRILGVTVGFTAGAVLALAGTFYLYGTDFQAVGWWPRVLAALIVGGLGALLGSLSGLGGS